jgi:CSLREA domain-containing protein
MVSFRCFLILGLLFAPVSLFATTFPVTKTVDTNDGTCDADRSLREAIEAANSNPGADDVGQETTRSRFKKYLRTHLVLYDVRCH